MLQPPSRTRFSHQKEGDFFSVFPPAGVSCSPPAVSAARAAASLAVVGVVGKQSYYPGSFGVGLCFDRAYAREHGDNDFVVPSGKAFRALLVQNGLFVKQQHGKNRTKEIRVNGTRHKVTVVFRDELEAWLGPMEQK